ncbi:MAG TPA: DNA recombination protein RmuC [Candidatus Binatia bacterium]|jgi:DNA recombination protein RmuC|nr:DNA recombination protein RmuC [Candidatus Binatia bacterium]
MSPLAYILAGILVGIVVGWLLRALRHPPLADNRLEAEFRQQLAQREVELSGLRSQLTEATNARAAAEAGCAAAGRLVADQREIHGRTIREAKEAQEEALADLREAFRALSAEALKQTAPEFLRLAEQNFGKLQAAAKGELAERQEAIKTLVEPLKQQLETYQQRLQQAENAQATALGEVKKQLETLGQQSLTLAQETLQFRIVLKSNQARGRWGEETLRRVVEAAGMSAHCDFSEQTQAGDGKPDLVVKLPGERLIIVDAKVPDLDFLSAMESADPTNRAESLVAHAAKLKATIKALADRDYPAQFPNALDHVVLFLPAESLFSAALEGDRDLIIWAASKRILLATPASLIALLRSVSVSWQQHAQTENAQKIGEAAQELYARVSKFSEHFKRIRAGLEGANAAFNDAVGSYERMVRPSGERLVKLSAGVPGKELGEIEPVKSALRLPANGQD